MDSVNSNGGFRHEDRPVRSRLDCPTDGWLSESDEIECRSSSDGGRASLELQSEVRGSGAEKYECSCQAGAEVRVPCFDRSSDPRHQRSEERRVGKECGYR